MIQMFYHYQYLILKPDHYLLQLRTALKLKKVLATSKHIYSILEKTGSLSNAAVSAKNWI